MDESLKWLTWANELQSMAQCGLTFARDPFDKQRYQRLQVIAAEILACQSKETFEQIYPLIQQEQHYLTPKLDVRTAIIEGSQILLVKEVSDGKWTMPGGWADVNESPSESAAKEVLEETGLSVDIYKLFALIDKRKRAYRPQLPYSYKCFFLGTITGGTITPSIETSAIEFFDKDSLPELSTDRVMAAQIELAFKHHNNPSLATEFD